MFVKKQSPKGVSYCYLLSKQEVGDDLSVCVLNLFPKFNTMPSLVVISLVKVEILIFQIVTWSKGHSALRFGTSHDKSSQFRCSWVFCKCRYNVFSLSRDLTRPLHLGVMQIFGWELLAACHHLDKFGHHRHCDGGGIMFLICHMTSCDHMFQGFYTYLATFGLVQVQIQKFNLSRDLKQTTWLKDHLTLWVGSPHVKSPPYQVLWP